MYSPLSDSDGSVHGPLGRSVQGHYALKVELIRTKEMEGHHLPTYVSYSIRKVIACSLLEGKRPCLLMKWLQPLETTFFFIVLLLLIYFVIPKFF